MYDPEAHRLLIDEDDAFDEDAFDAVFEDSEDEAGSIVALVVGPDELELEEVDVDPAGSTGRFVL